MKAIIVYIIITFTGIMAFAQNTLYITANSETKTATLVENEATAALKDILADGPVVISMSDNGGFEKVGDLPQSLIHTDSRQTAQSGDIMLYVGRTVCIFYGSNTWAYTKLGKIDNMTASEIKNFLSGSSVNVTLSMSPMSSVNDIAIDVNTDEIVYDLAGRCITNRPLAPGVYVVNGVKKIIND